MTTKQDLVCFLHSLGKPLFCYLSVVTAPSRVHPGNPFGNLGELFFLKVRLLGCRSIFEEETKVPTFTNYTKANYTSHSLPFPND